MLTDVTVIVLSAAVFLALILYLALEQKQREKLMGIAFFISAGGGIIMYGFGYSHGHCPCVCAGADDEHGTMATDCFHEFLESLVYAQRYGGVRDGMEVFGLFVTSARRGWLRRGRGGVGFLSHAAPPPNPLTAYPSARLTIR